MLVAAATACGTPQLRRVERDLACGAGGPCCTPCDGGACLSAGPIQEPGPDAGGSPDAGLGVCDDGNPCTADLCADSGCVHLPVPDGTPCDDGDACNGLSACLGGSCEPAAPLRCVSADPCMVGRCDPAQGCLFTALPDGTSCDDGDACNGREVCRAGRCRSGPPLVCNDANPCTTDRCDPRLGCVYTPLAEGLSCGETNACQEAGTCQRGECLAPSPRSCDDGNPCTSDTCDGVAGCQHPALPNGTSCGDGDLCNGAEFCQAGVCAAGVRLSCDDGNPCTRDTCESTRGCVYARLPDGTSCGASASCITGKCTPVEVSGASPFGKPGQGCGAVPAQGPFGVLVLLLALALRRRR